MGHATVYCFGSIVDLSAGLLEAKDPFCGIQIWFSVKKKLFELTEQHYYKILRSAYLRT